MVIQIEPVKNEAHILAEEDVRILIVDDREDNLLSIETILEGERYTIVKANGGRAALKTLLKDHNFSLILMDVQMPDMSGFETASLIYQREKLRDIPIIFVTAHHESDEQLSKGFKLGGVDYIHKPINADLLRFKVSVFVDLYRKKAQLLKQETHLRAVNQNLKREIEERKINEEKVHRLNQQLMSSNQELLAINEELDRFAYVASHDLQEPLRKIQLFGDKLKQSLEGASGSVQGYLEKVVRSSERMQKLIIDLLKFSRHSYGAEDFLLVDLAETMKHVLVDLELDIARKQASIEVKSLPVVRAIPSQIGQVLQNLVSNSLKFSDENRTLSIRISAEKRMINNVLMHRVSVEDNGIGFDTKYTDEIFMVFKRLHSYHEFEGTGIGLSICKKIIDQHGGHIEVTSEPGKGSCFSFLLP